MNVANDNVRPREWYAPTSTGPQAQFYDFRSTSDDDDWGGSRPSVEPGQLWEDLEFGLYEAITDRETTENLKWKRPSVSIVITAELDRNFIDFFLNEQSTLLLLYL